MTKLPGSKKNLYNSGGIVMRKQIKKMHGWENCTTSLGENWCYLATQTVKIF